MKIKKATRVRDTTIKRQVLPTDVKSEMASTQQHRNAPTRSLRSSAVKNITLSIKQEDSKNDTLQKELKLRRPASNSDITEEEDNVQIKQEDDMPKSEALVNAKETGSKGYCYYCRICKAVFANIQSAIDHRRSFHNLYPRKASMIKHMDLEPDIDDPNNFCQSCEITYSKRKLYRHHLTYAHHMLLQTKRVGPLNNLIPDPYDPNFHCCSCETTYPHKYSYRHHLKHIHSIRMAPNYRTTIKNTDVLPDWNDPTYYCPSCERHYKKKMLFRAHCRKIHRMKDPKTKERELPDLHDSNFHCKICDITHKNKQSYRSHCHEVHRMPKPNNECNICGKSFSSRGYLIRHTFVFHKMTSDSTLQPTSSTEPDVNDPNKYCKICDKVYSSKQYFKRHLRAMHFIGRKGQEPEETKPNSDNPDHSPDPLDPNWYCRVCKSYFKSHDSYRNHCRSIHRMKLVSLLTVNVYPNAEIDINDPSHYCAKCDRKMKTKGTFRQHLKYVHDMELLPTRGILTNPEATIDPNDSNLYCAQCENYYSNKNSFKKHLKQIHQIVI
ncbi:hypothetical protein MBANPS3_007215 [Mucor bainieri]